MQRINLDHNGASQPLIKSLDILRHHQEKMWGSHLSPHSMGYELQAPIEKAKESIFKLVKASVEDRLYLFDCGAAANTALLHTVCRDISMQRGTLHYLTTSSAPSSIVLTAHSLQSYGVTLDIIPNDERGVLNANSLGDALTTRTALLSLPLADPLTGVIQDCSEIAALCKERGILFHLDISYIVGKRDIDLNDLAADVITFDGNGLHAPKSCGCLILREHVKDLGDFTFGASLNTGALAALGHCAQEAIDSLDHFLMEGSRLRSLFEEKIQEAIPGALVHFENEDRIPNTSAISFPNVHNDTLLFALNRSGILASFGGNPFPKINLAVAQTKLAPSLADSTLCFSFDRFMDEETLLEAVQKIKESYEKYAPLAQHLLRKVL